MEMLEMSSITKRYPGTLALDGVNFKLHQEEILSLLGENGAGKTTLMKILYGMTKPDMGDIYYKGEKLTFKTPRDAIGMGICMVHQHFMLVQAFTVTENIILGNEPHNGAFVNMKKAREEVLQLIEQFNFNLDPDITIDKLSVGEQQRVEILKALYRKVDVLILDEPTAVLTPTEVKELFIILNKLRKQGKSIVIITHKLKETMAIADRITVLRDGKIIRDDVIPSKTNIQELSEMMVGRDVVLGVSKPAENIGDVCLSVRNLNLIESQIDILKDISFDIRKGEILGVGGVEGNGQTQLLEVLTGLKVPDTVDMEINGKKLSGNANKFLRTGIGHVPEDRLKMGLVKEMSVKNNLILGYHREKDLCNRGILKKKEIKRYAEELKNNFGIKVPTIEHTIKCLSGGNQQKVVIARTISRNPEVLIVAHPTRGVDVGAMEYIHTELLKLRDQGKAILLVSADLDEVRALSDRMVILYEGEIVAKSTPDELTEIQMGMLMTGSSLSSVMEVENEHNKA